MSRIGIALGGGGIAGCAHLGIIKALEETGIVFHCVAGTSSGGLVAALYACGYTTDQIIQMVPELSKKYMDYDYRSLISRMLWKDQNTPSIIKGKKFREFLGIKLQNRQIKDIDLPVALIAADLKTAKKIVFSSKPLISDTDDYEEIADISVVDAILASCSIPTIFPPVKIGEKLLVDGGLIDNCPSEYAKALGAEKIIAVDLCTTGKHLSPLTSLVSIVNRAVSVFLVHQAKSLHNHTSIMLCPDVSHIGSLAFNKTSECIEIGYEYTRNRMSEIEAALEIAPEIMLEPIVI
jgi:NTE family protein